MVSENRGNPLFYAMLALPMFLIKAPKIDARKTCTYYYWWYSGDPTDWCWGKPAHQVCLNKPLLGWYDSLNEAVIEQHSIWLKDFDFIILSSWNINSQRCLNVSDEVFNRFRACIMLTYDDNDLSELQKQVDYIHDHYVGGLYEKHRGKPLLIIWRGGNRYLDLEDERFTIRWMATTAIPDQKLWWNYSTLGFSNMVNPPNKEWMVVHPGFDDRHLGKDNYLPRSLDNYIKQLYRTRQIKPEIECICSFNEHPETTALEPTEAWGEEYLRLI